MANTESKNFALLPIFAFDDDYVPLSPIVTPSPEDKPTRKQKTARDTSPSTNSVILPHVNSFIPVPNKKDLTTISETSEMSSSMVSSQVPRAASPMRESKKIRPLPRDLDESVKTPTSDGRSSPEVQVLDITDLNDPGVRVVSKFSFKDMENKFHITIFGKLAWESAHSIEPDFRFAQRC